MLIEDISYSEYKKLFNGLMSDTPLVKVMSIRSETDPEIIKRFGKYENEIRRQWRQYRNHKIMDNMSDVEKTKRVLAFQKAVKEAFGKKER